MPLKAVIQRRQEMLVRLSRHNRMSLPSRRLRPFAAVCYDYGTRMLNARSLPRLRERPCAHLCMHELSDFHQLAGDVSLAALHHTHLYEKHVRLWLCRWALWQNSRRNLDDSFAWNPSGTGLGARWSREKPASWWTGHRCSTGAARGLRATVPRHGIRPNLCQALVPCLCRRSTSGNRPNSLFHTTRSQKAFCSVVAFRSSMLFCPTVVPGSGAGTTQTEWKRRESNTTRRGTCLRL